MDRGFSLVEVLVASTLLTIGVLGLAQLSIVSIRTNTLARLTTLASTLALQKTEQLKALTWSYDAAGNPSSDTTTNTAANPETSGGTGLVPSPPNTLTRNTVGYVDYLDGGGRSLGGGPGPPASAVFVRRWSIDALPGMDALIVQVSVTRSETSGFVSNNINRRIDEARIVSVRTRKAGW